MARYVATADTVVDGIDWPRGSVVNIPTSALALSWNADLDLVPRVRPAGLVFHPDNYQSVPLADQIGLQQSTQTLPEEGTIKEPVLPAENTPYD
jgi:hypothetical protein